MIKGSLLVSIPIIKRFLVENFLSPKTRTFGSVFRTSWKNPWTDIHETYGQLLPSQALRPAIFGATLVPSHLPPGRFQTAVRASHYRGRASPKCLATGIAVWPAILVRIGRYNIDAKRATLPTSLPVSFTEDLVSFKRCTLLLYVHSLILASKPSRLPACFLTNRLEF